MISRYLFTVGIAAAASGLGAKAAAAPKPNIVFILADDLGWADVGFNGPDIRTPQIDRLARAGARLDDFYMQPLCSPSRASLMTGRYPIRYGLQVGVVRPWAQYGLPLEERTLPRALNEAGYLTAIFGKWHLGHFQRDYLPMERGFARQYGMYNGAIDYFKHLRDGGLDWHRDEKPCYDEGYTTNLIAEESVHLIERQDGKRPFFLYAAFNAPHAPFQAPEKYSAPYANLRGQRQVYAGMVAALDEAIGRIVTAVEKRGLRGNTIFIFSSDNGGPSPGEITSNGPFRDGKGTVYEGGTRVAACVTWDGHIPAGSVVTAPLHAVDWYPTLVKLAGGSLKQKLPLDGRDAWPCIAQGKASPHDAILLNTSPKNGAIRMGAWKLVRNGYLVDAEEGGPALPVSDHLAKRPASVSPPGDQIELFNLETDPGERTNLAARYPDKVKELRASLDAFQREAAVPKISGVKPPGFVAPKIWGEWD